MYSHFGVKEVGWETDGSLETSEKGKGRGLIPRDPQVSQPTHLTITYKHMYSHFGVRGVGWETYGSLETSEKEKGR